MTAGSNTINDLLIKWLARGLLTNSESKPIIEGRPLMLI